jgi:sulfotransferase
MSSILYLTGLPRAGSTLLCQLLDHHPDIDSPGHSSPLAQMVLGLRYQISDSDFFLAQLDADFERGYGRLLSAYRGLMAGWFADSDRAWVVDKSRSWLHHLELVQAIDPDFKMLVCIRELGQIYGSIEDRHQQTIALDFPDHLANLSREGRALKLFEPDGVVGGPLRAIEALQDVDTRLQEHLYYVIFEDLMDNPQGVMQGLCQWLDLPALELDPHQLRQQPQESDSYYRFKYPHTRRSAIAPPTPHLIPARIQAEIQRQAHWFYRTFYPGLLPKTEAQ